MNSPYVNTWRMEGWRWTFGCWFDAPKQPLFWLCCCHENFTAKEQEKG